MIRLETPRGVYRNRYVNNGVASDFSGWYEVYTLLSFKLQKMLCWVVLWAAITTVYQTQRYTNNCITNNLETSLMIMIFWRFQIPYTLYDKLLLSNPHLSSTGNGKPHYNKRIRTKNPPKPHTISHLATLTVPDLHRLVETRWCYSSTVRGKQHL